MAWCIVGSMVLSVWGGLFALKQVAYGRLSGVAPIYHSSKALLSVSLPIAVVSLSNVVSMQSDKLILGAFVDAADVGLYNAAFRIAWFLQLILLSFGVFPPIVADLYNRGRVEELRSLLDRTTRWIFSAMFPLFLVIVLFPKELIGVFGPEFMEGWPILVALSFLFLVDALTGQVGPVLRMTGNQGIEAAINATSVVLSVLVNLILVQQHGVLGVAVGTTLILSLQRVSKAIALYIVLGIHPYDRCFLRPVAVGLLGLGAVWVVRSLNWTILGVSEALLEASLLIGVYLGLSLLFFPEEDIATLKLIFFRVIQGIWNR
jgi:O-antigen/teichoic acid export membrane protein